jgi:Lrp/AsnC family transcriptional regulator for asnA, asnC and gidA
MKMDELDLRLIEELQKDGRKQYVSLARKIGVTEGTIRNRLKKMEKCDLIGITAQPNLEKIGYGFTVIMGLHVKTSDLALIADKLARNRNVCYLTFVTGRYDLLAIVVTKSPQDLSRFIEKEVSTVPGVLGTETFVTLDVLKGINYCLDTRQIVTGIKEDLVED